MKKLGVFLLVSSIEYFDHLLVKNYAGNGFKKSIFFSLSKLKSANIMFLFLFKPKIFAQTQFFHCLRGKEANKTEHSFETSIHLSLQ